MVHSAFAQFTSFEDLQPAAGYFGVVDWEGDPVNLLSVEDPYFLFYLRWSDKLASLTPEQRFDSSVAVPPGSSFDIARKLVALADEKMYEAKRAFRDSTDPHITQINVRITGGQLIPI